MSVVFQGKPGAKHNITKNCDLRKTFDTAADEEKLIHNNPILSAVIKNHLQSYDPRSPTQDFERTPIVIGSKIDGIKNGKKLVKHLSESCESPQLNNTEHDTNCGSYSEVKDPSHEIFVPKDLCNEFCDMSLNGTNILEVLGSSPASSNIILNKSPITKDHKPTKLLETNFDYVEGDKEKSEDSCNDVESPCDSIIGIDNLRKATVFEILDIDPRSPSIGIERTPLVVAKIDVDRDDNVEEMSDDSLLKVLQSTNAELRQAISKNSKAEEGLLVYEDETTNINDTPRKIKPNSNSGSRTPLSCMKNKDGAQARSKSANMLFDPKNQKVAVSKIPKRVSHIPRLKSLSKPTKLIPAGSSVSLKNISKASSIGGDCENTPPHSHRDRWDKDSSIVL